MSASTTHRNGSSGTFDATQGDWKERAMRSLQGPLPANVDPAEHEGLVHLVEQFGVDLLDKGSIKLLNRVIESQENPQLQQAGENTEQEEVEANAEVPVVTTTDATATEKPQGEPEKAPAQPEGWQRATTIESKPKGKMRSNRHRYFIGCRFTPMTTAIRYGCCRR